MAYIEFKNVDKEYKIGEEFVLEEDKTIIMPKDLPHSVYGEKNLKCY